MTGTIEILVEHRVARITLNRPEVRNAFSDAVIAELTQAFQALGAREDVRCIVLAANGTAFCAGADLHWMQRMAGYSRDENLADAAKLAGLLRIIDECPKPTVARVQGDVYAGGMGLVACCDVAVSVDSAYFCLSEVKLGLVAATISPYVMRALGPRASHRYFLTAERFCAAQALRLGFVHEMVAADELDAKIDDITKALTSNSPYALRTCKALLHEVAYAPINERLIEMTQHCIADARASDEGREGMAAFLEKRKPAWLNNHPPQT